MEVTCFIVLAGGDQNPQMCMIIHRCGDLLACNAHIHAGQPADEVTHMMSPPSDLCTHGTMTLSGVEKA